ncbi:MAG: hypothetical protein ABIP38_13865 [Steroidobacteraceae bacterium]
MLNFGKFRLLNIGDLNSQPLFDLVCPRDLLGMIDLYLFAHHGGTDAAEPATLVAFQPRAVIVKATAYRAWAEEAHTRRFGTPDQA